MICYLLIALSFPALLIVAKAFVKPAEDNLQSEYRQEKVAAAAAEDSAGVTSDSLAEVSASVIKELRTKRGKKSESIVLGSPTHLAQSAEEEEEGSEAPAEEETPKEDAKSEK